MQHQSYSSSQMPRHENASRSHRATTWQLALVTAAVLLLLSTLASPAAAQTAADLKLAARTAFEEGDTAKAKATLQALRQFYRSSTANDGSPPAAYLWSSRLAEVAREFLRGGQVADALEVLGEAADLILPHDDQLDDGLASAAAGLHRRLAALDAQERFELLHAWTLPAESRSRVRVLTTITPTLAPPPVFARALSERPRRDSFSVARIGEVRGLFSTAWALVQAADESGRLRGLASEVSSLLDDDVPNARLLSTLIMIARAKKEAPEVTAELQAYAQRIGSIEGARFDDDLIVGAACLTRDWLNPVGERIFKTKLEQTFGAESLRMRPFLRYALVVASRQQYPDASPGLLTESSMQLWVPASTQHTWPSPQGNVRSLWLSDEDHILHAFGPRHDYLLFKFPLTGEFEFSCETQIGGPGGTDGCIGYGGLGYEVLAERSLARIWNTSLQKLAEFPCSFVRAHPIATFSHFSLTSSPGRVTFSANRHPLWHDESKEETSPWIGLRAYGERGPVFRGFKISGNPVIPRQVNMSAGSSLRGWVADFYGEQTPPVAPPELGLGAFLTRMLTGYDWSASDGVIHGARRASTGDAPAESRLYYLRPLQSGDSVSYDFKYQPDQFEVHPTLGRIAFLIEPGGVRLHWMTDGEHEWTGLPEDNAVVEPLNRSGPRPLPLVAGEWNRVTVELVRDTLTLSLNDTQIYKRKMEPEIGRTFGFYHDKNRSGVRVRNVVMRGDWPEQVPTKQLNRLAAVTKPERSPADRQLLAAVFDDRHVHGSVFAVRRRAAALPLEKRYEFLADWVLPGVDHHRLRLALDFTPTNPAPPVDDPPQTPAARPEGGPLRTRVSTGGDLVSPALDLVAVAKELGRLDALRKRVAALDILAEAQQLRSQLAMLALIDIAAGDLAAAKDSLDELASLVAAGSKTGFFDRWPETLVIQEAAPYSETRDSIRDMAFQILLTQTRKRISSGNPAWDYHMAALAGRVRHFDLLERNPELQAASQQHQGVELPLTNWISASRETGYTRGQGFPRAHWVLSAPATVENFVTHHDDYLFYRSPLRGDFEVECDVSGFGYRETTLWLAGRWIGPVHTFRHVDIGNFRSSWRPALDPPIHKPDDWIRYRAVVRNSICRIYANGREIHQRVLDAEPDPWLAIRSWYKTNGAVRNVRITGNPEIPAEVRLTANDDLPGWLPINRGHRVGPGRKWEQLGNLENGGGIRGIHWPSLPGSHWETLLRYHRPMVEDGTIEYEFFYREGKVHVHPALDRLAFMLQPDGVGEHWVGDEQFDRTDLPPDNLYDRPQNRRGAGPLPLQPDTWNRLRLSLVGDTVRLELNGDLIYERELEATNQRTFGLFHYADRTEALVRGMVWRGAWPRQLPPVAEQELAGDGLEFLDESREQLAAVFEHDFATHGLAKERFGLVVGGAKDFDQRPEGLGVTRPGGDGYKDSAIAPRLTIHGDFDIVAAFDQFQSQPSDGGSGGVFLQAILDSEKANECLIYRRYLRRRAEPQPIVQGQYVGREIGGARRSHFMPQVVEAPGGKLRLARRGETVYFLFAENDSPHFRLFGTETVPPHDIRLLKLMTQTHLEGMTKVVWKSLTIHADELSGLALQDPKAMVAKLDTQRDALPQSFQHDFAKDALTEARFEWTGVYQKAGGNGAKLVSPGSDRWTAVGFNPAIGLQGDFDASVTFEGLKLATPSGERNSTMYLQVEFDDPKNTFVNLILVVYVDRPQQIYAQIRQTDDGGNLIYRRIQIDDINFAEVEKLRLVRRGKRFLFLYRTRGLDYDRVLAEADSLDLPVPPRNLHWFLHTGGDDRQSEVLLKQFQVKGETIDPNPALEPGGVLKSLRALPGR